MTYSEAEHIGAMGLEAMKLGTCSCVPELDVSERVTRNDSAVAVQERRWVSSKLE
jgi:hypothetical protein